MGKNPPPEELRRLIEGREDAWLALVREHSGILHAVSRRTFAAYGFNATTADEEDAVAEVWKNVVDHDCGLLRQAADRGNLLQMLFVLVRHRTIDIMRRHRIEVQPLTGEEEDESSTLSAEPDAFAGRRVPPEAMAALTPRERVCIKLFFLQDRKYREIAELTGMPVNSIGPTLRRAIERLRRIIPRPEV